MKQENVLITGVAGFIGSHLADYFLAKGFRVIGIDNLLTGDIKNIEHLIENKNFELQKKDVTKYIDVKENLNYILHFASPASPIDYTKIPIPTLKIGALGTLNCLGLAKAKKARILIASTSEVYGDPLVSPQPESYWGNTNPIGRRSVYDEAKRFAESLTMAYHQFHKIDTRIARIFNTYGPRMRLNDGRVLPSFVQKATLLQPLTVFGTGQQTRSFCYISDLVEGIFRLLMNEDYFLPVNLGNPEEITILDFAKEILAYYKQDEKNIVFCPLPENDPQQRKPDITLAKKILGWSPHIGRKEGVKNVMAYYASKPISSFCEKERFK